MNAQRYNTFNLAHKGLRALLYDTALKLQQADLSDQSSIESIGQVEQVLGLFESHAHHEDQFFNEPLEQSNPDVAKVFEKEHEEDHRLARVIARLIDSWKDAALPEKRQEIGKHLFYAFNEFIAFNLYHMNKEELQLNEVLWKEYSDDTIKATEQALVQAIPPAKMAAFAHWMIKGINNPELTKWLGEVKRFAPAPVFEMLDGIAKTQLADDHYNKIRASVEKESIVVL